MEETQEPIKLEENWRNPDGTLKPGHPNLGAGRPKGKTLKEYARDYYMLKTDEEKKAYIENLEEKKPGFAWTMAEGGPPQEIEHSGEITQRQYIITDGISETPTLPATPVPDTSSEGQS